MTFILYLLSCWFKKIDNDNQESAVVRTCELNTMSYQWLLGSVAIDGKTKRCCVKKVDKS